MKVSTVPMSKNFKVPNAYRGKSWPAIFMNDLLLEIGRFDRRK